MVPATVTVASAPVAPATTTVAPATTVATAMAPVTAMAPATAVSVAAAPTVAPTAAVAPAGAVSTVASVVAAANPGVVLATGAVVVGTRVEYEVRERVGVTVRGVVVDKEDLVTVARVGVTTIVIVVTVGSRVIVASGVVVSGSFVVVAGASAVVLAGAVATVDACRCRQAPFLVGRCFRRQVHGLYALVDRLKRRIIAHGQPTVYSEDWLRLQPNAHLRHMTVSVIARGGPLPGFVFVVCRLVRGCVSRNGGCVLEGRWMTVVRLAISERTKMGIRSVLEP